MNKNEKNTCFSICNCWIVFGGCTGGKKESFVGRGAAVPDDKLSRKSKSENGFVDDGGETGDSDLGAWEFCCGWSGCVVGGGGGGAIRGGWVAVCVWGVELKLLSKVLVSGSGGGSVVWVNSRSPNRSANG